MIENNEDNITTIVLGAIATFLILTMLVGCTVYKQPQMKITSVLAVTAEGDTLMLPIDVIRPIYNYNTYPTNRYPIGYGNNTFYYSPHRYQPVYGNSNYKPIGGGNNNNNPNISQSGSTVKPSGSVTPPSTPVNPRKN